MRSKKSARSASRVSGSWNARSASGSGARRANQAVVQTASFHGQRDLIRQLLKGPSLARIGPSEARIPSATGNLTGAPCRRSH